MTLASGIAACLFFSLTASAVPIRARTLLSAQAFQSEAPQENSPAQPTAGQEGNPPPPPAAPEQSPPPVEPPPDAAKPSQSSESGQTAPAASTPATGQEPQNTQPAPAPEATKATPQPPANKPPSSPKRTATAKRKATHRTHQGKATASAKSGTPKKVVVKNGSAADPSVQLAPGLTQQQASSKRQGTDQLLANTDQNLKKISGQQLASNQQEMVQQIRKYEEQARAATAAGDLDRAHNLALKASLLAQELAKP